MEDALSYDKAGKKQAIRKLPRDGSLSWNFFKPKGKVAEGGGVLFLGW